MLELDENGYDIVTGFNRKGIHKVTHTRYDEDGFDYKGYDEKGYNKYGYNREGDKLETGKKKIKIKREKPTKENDSLFIYNGSNARGFFKDGRNVFRGEYDRRGFRFDGTNIDTGTQYNKYGHDAYGYNQDGYDEYGFNKEGINEYTGTKYDLDGFDRERFNARGFSAITRKHRITGTVYDEKGFNIDGLWHGKNVYSLETGYDVNGFNSEGIHEETQTKFNPDGYDRDGYNQNGYDRNGYDRLGINSEGINIDTQKKDERLFLAEEFIEAGKSIEKFAQDKQMDIEEIRAKLEEIRKSPVMSERITLALGKNASRFKGAMQTKKMQLLAGEISVKDITGIDVILRLSSNEEREKITELLIKQVAAHDIKVLEYGNIFGIQNIDSSLPKAIIERLKLLNGQARMSQNKNIKLLSKEMYKEIDRMKAFSTPYIASPGEQLGYMEHPEDTAPKMVTITDEHRDMARQYIKATDEFICNKTMQATLMQIVRGQLNLDMINRATAEKELRTLQKRDKELDEATQLAEKVIEERKIGNKENDTFQNINDDSDSPSL